ncbi:two-component system response regulator [Caulobacter radicis]|uniref:Two-component system response regulator n=1 Tax=Caulobacter radicis TaxID=2172650 RepID=A0A2T9JY10_9CAUL|nr:two-component system response regulator [Caulobacter radicis]PVM88421.1 two-component system response regulator [Caulobacter radicis]
MDKSRYRRSPSKGHSLSTAPVFAIIDDDEALRQALAELLEVSGYDCRTFADADGFLSAYAPGRFICLVTDLNLPGKSGLVLQQHMRCMDPGLPVIIISANPDALTRSRCLASGAVAYLIKPIRDQVLLRHLAAALGRC